MAEPEPELVHGSLTIAPIASMPPSSTEQMNSCLTDLFLGPSQGIEKAFRLVLDMINSQQEKYNELVLEHEALRQQNGLLLENMKEIQDSSLGMLDKLKENEILVKTVENVKLETRELVTSVREIEATQNEAGKDLSDLRKEIKVRFANAFLLLRFRWFYYSVCS